MENRYHYDLPESLIARQPAEPRDAARLFVYDTAHDEVAFDVFSNLGAHLPARSLLVLNDTKVVPARAELKKETGGKIEVLFLVNEWRQDGSPIPALVDRKVAVGARLFFGDRRSFTVVRQNENIFYLEPNFPPDELFRLLDKKGVTPLPKYIKHSGLSEATLRKEYQAVFGKNPASVAAPTASLHFTERLLAKLEAQGIERTFVTLNVGLGTFAPVSAESLASGTLHTEYLSIPAPARATIKAHKLAGVPVVAAGTTVVRTLEAEAAAILSKAGHSDITGPTKIFIRPPYEFRIADAVITNFHLPDTSLMMLVQAFLLHKGATKRNLVDLYRIAIEAKFRFYSFGDAMLIK
ncbi:MAG: tRNA preQ1(34) S-adenosylmethionine ribosyltransferase-isomerase QueA [Candidatus Pacebacteria bacterium]|nr:tRNA preQ1(34) S-adenosylmethionine ribosyltransferase-isomerase QueA [Candidatus Paceibacterota bacterium]